jgi:hypothetical protein
MMAGRVSAVVLVLFVTLSLATARTTAEDAKPLLEIPSPHYDAGTHWEGETVSHTFLLKNNGSAELRILRLRPG